MGSQKRSRESSTQDGNSRSTKRSKHSNNEETKEAGQIEFLHLENFMCHRNLKVNLKTGVNVITGNNGSGKSAILAALQLALGSKAKSTHRGTSFKDVIKEGEDSCRVTVHLSNGGADAYEPDTFGSRIIVVRRLSKTSASSYKIQDEDGRTVSSSVKDLHKILDHFNILLDNPSTVLGQEVSRVFLANASPSDKYRFFLEATLLQKMIDDFGESVKHKALMERIVQQKEESIKDSKRQLDRLKKEFDDASHLKDLESQIADLDNQLLWAVVRDKETFLKRFKERLEGLEAERDTHLARKRDLDEQQANFEKQMEEIRTELGEKTTEFKAHDESLIRERDAFVQIKKQSGLVERGIEDWQTRIRQCNQRIATLNREIKKLEEEANRDKSGELRARDEKIARYTKMIEDEQVALKENRENQNTILDELNQAEEQVRNASTSVQATRTQIERLKYKIEQMRRQNQDPLAYYNNEMRNLLREIEKKRNRFKKCPVGPIGMMVKVKDLQWAGAVELALKNSLSSFVVDNSQDRQLLTSLAQRCRVNISAITQAFTDHVYTAEQLHRGGVPDEQYFTILHAVEADPQRARLTGISYDQRTAFATAINALIDQSNIAQTILARDDDEAKRIMFGRQPPAYTMYCFSMNGSRFQKRGTTEVMDARKSAYSTLWAENFDNHIRQLNAELEHLEREHREQHNELKKFEQEARKVKSRQNVLREEERKFNRSLKHAEQSLDAINREPLPEQDDRNEDEIKFKQGLISQEEGKIKEYEENIRKHREENQDMIAKMEEATKKVRELENRKKEMKIGISGLTQKLDAVRANLTMVRSSYVNVERALVTFERNVEVIKTKIEEQEKEVADCIAIAVELCPTRLYPTMSVDDIKNKRKALNTTRSQEQTRFGGRSLREIEQSYTDHLRFYTHAKEAIDSAVHDLATFKKSLESRYVKWQALKQHYMHVTDRWFDIYLSQKNHSGRLAFNEAEDKLETVVYRSSGGNKTDVKDTKSLSGGERSYTTTAFLLALWQVVESPFRCLDEFDVFMDSVYRKKSFDMLIGEALKNKTRQLIIITPHSVSMLTGDVHVVRLRPPARDGMQQQTLDDFAG